MAKKKKIEPLKNITRHELVPDHVILTDKEKQQLLTEYHIEPSQLPKMLTTDPVALSIGAESGEIVKITRESYTAKESTAYRLVVEDNK
ncbi:MAG: DNA-directed RNA polymerase subunit H [Candidatus Thermoplasmatota archaeon]|jgi:DNA-directed RNA polymerase subunit H (RpoH/RPB5)|nr:DNA-directed RNA polymerase subunit H [Candidatus Thermoplasmatota archaeon]MBS3801162.1 DNA-directed RNA polymerase subunit H [Candidatus Thermoplasmatota archaeon]